MSVMGKTILFVLLTLLKILGILLLTALLLILLVLFVAVRYRLCVRLEERRLEGSASWLGFVVRVPFHIEEGEMSWRLRLLGIPIMGSRRRKKSSAGRKSKKDRKKATEEKTGGNRSKKKQIDNEIEKQESCLEETTQESTLEKAEEESQLPADRQSGSKHGQKRTLWKWISSLLRKLKEKLRAGIEQVTEWIKTLVTLVRMLRHKVHSVGELIEILRTEHGRAFICIAKENVIHLLGKLRPRVVKGDIIFGLGDPCTTGQALGALAVLYAWLGTGVKVTPDFMEKRLEGYIRMRGRIRIVTLIHIALRIIWNKEGKRLQSELQKWKEDF